MRCPDCGQTFKVLDQLLYDFTTTILGCPVTGHWPKYTARVYVDNVELLKCNCGVCANVPDLEGLHHSFFGTEPSHNILNGNIALDPYSNWIYMGTWDNDDQEWVMSRHREQ